MDNDENYTTKKNKSLKITAEQEISNLFQIDKNLRQNLTGVEDLIKDKKFYEKSKRALDIVFAVLGIIFIFPVFVITALIVKLNSPGPIFFKQIRIGQNRRKDFCSNGKFLEKRSEDLKGKPFTIYKFRTMILDVNPYGISPQNSNDSRLTKSGRIIRKFCIDELPQLFNILKGDMSIVGPRPEMQFIVKEYNQREQKRLLAKPGLTGLWQLYCPRDKFIHEHLEYDLTYIKDRKLWLDIKIIFKTILFIFSIRNV